MTLPIGTSGYNEIQMILPIGTSGYNIRYTSEYITKLKIHQQSKHSPFNNIHPYNTRNNVETHLGKTTKVLFIWNKKYR